ncbi:hypothetical protein [Stenotrophomonas acidaminiphila]|uniref:hypothetical protein n=1 Tax=Stenotrophomonas acidaminiphila TaxID=128780 RepID=UPI001FAEF988|nr:hypothetical protein [Stenotrophomonas acidaminiphila]
MALTDNLDDERREVARAGTPGTASSAPPVARRPAVGTVVGTALRTGVMGGALAGRQMVNRVASTAATAADRGTAPIRGALGFARDAGRALTGMPAAPNAGQPVGLPSLPSLPSLGRGPVAAKPNFSDVTGRVLGGTRPRADFSDVTSRVLSAPPAATAEPPIAARPMAGAAAQVVAPRPVPEMAVRGRQGAVIRNPNDTLVDKLTRAMGSASLKGSPSGRAAVAQAILGEAGAQRDERMQTLRTQDQADLQALQANAVSAEHAANRQLEASKANAQLADSAAGRENNLEMARLARRPEVSVSADGTMGVIGADGSWRPVTGADGAAVRAPQAPRQTGELTDGDRLKSYTERYNAIQNNVGSSPEERRAAVDELNADPLYAPLRPASAAPSAPSAPAVGAVVDGYRFNGGDPSVQSNWVKVN